MTEPFDEDTRVPTSIHSAPQILSRLTRGGVVGQEVGKRDLATLLAMHLHWYANPKSLPEHTAPNALIIGPTGVGKTHAIKTAAEALGIPLAIADATRFSAGDFRNESLDDVLIELLRAARRLIHSNEPFEMDNGPLDLEEVNLARKGVVFLDEFDKLASRSNVKDERNEVIQRRLLQFTDGAHVTLPASRHTGETEIVFDTSGVLFIVAGAFTDLPTGPGSRSHRTMRSLSNHNHVILEDLISYGFMKELIARIPVIIEFNQLAKEDLVKIMRTPSVDPTLFYVQYLSSLGTQLTITDEARAWVADRAEDLDVGARGLHQVLFPILSLLSQDVEDARNRPKETLLDRDKMNELSERVEERRSARTTDA